MSNLSTAKSALRAELVHVQAGLAYYQERVETLNDAITQLDAIAEEPEMEAQPAVPARRGRKPGQKAKRARTVKKTGKAAGRKPRSASRLPATGGDFFPGLLGVQGRSTKDLLDAALGNLSFKPNAGERAQLRSRMVAALNAMLKAGKIGSEGRGRQRTYFVV